MNFLDFQVSPIDIYVDLDGTLYDFEARLKELLGHSFAGHNTEEVWKKLTAFPDLYKDLPLLSDAMDLWGFVRPYKPRILTAIPRLEVFDRCAQHKKASVVKDLGQHVEVLYGPYSKDKHLYCKGSRSLLIDDNKRNCEQWHAAGGTAILHKDAYTTIQLLSNMGL